MGTTPVLLLTATDLKRRLNPLNNEGLFQYGGATNITEAAVDEILAEQEDTVLSMLPEKYSAMIEEVEGEILVKSAVGGETTLTLKLFPVVTGSIALYVDYGGGSAVDSTGLTSPFLWQGKRPYSDRNNNDLYPTSKFSPNYTTGVITFSPVLQPGQNVMADYRHTATSKSKFLRNMVLVMASAEVYETFPMFNSANADFDAMRVGVAQKIDSLYNDQRGATGIRLFDNVKLERETRKIPGTALKLPLLGGM